MDKKTVLITGASDGIGASAAKMLGDKGWDVAVIGRNEGRTRAVAASCGGRSYIADFADLAKVKALAEELRRDFPHIDVLCCNAGGMFRAGLSLNGYDMTFQVNHLAHFLLTNLLMDRLLESRARVIATSSVAHRLTGFAQDTERMDARPLSSTALAYGSAKKSNILFVKELHRRFHAQGLSTAAFHPGVVATSFARDARSPVRIFYLRGIKRLFRLKTPAEGADTLVFLAEGTPGVDWQSGEYYCDRRAIACTRAAQDPAAARKLWELSLEYCQRFL